MRSFRHWTPRYVWDRVLLAFYQYRFPDEPWLTRQANALLADLLRPTDVGMEFGCGRSTIWFAQRISRLTSVEHDRAWFEKVQRTLDSRGINNVELLIRDVDFSVAADADRYLDEISARAPESVDFALVDGIFRDSCAVRVVPLIAIGGILVVDNVNWYLPSDSRSPSSIPVGGKPGSPIWQEFQKMVCDWRCIWTCDGVTATAIYIRTN